MKRKKKIRILILLSICIIVTGLTTGIGLLIINKFKGNELFQAAESVGTLPGSLNKNVLKNGLITNAVKTDDGYYKVKAAKQPTIEKYNLDGKKLWGKSYSCDDDNFTIKNMILMPDGDVEFTVNPNNEKSGNPVIYKCDKSGNLVWSYKYENLGNAVLEHIFADEQGNVLTIGYTQSEDIYLTKLSADGKKTAEKTYGGSGSDTLINAAYEDGVGLSALINTQSEDGTFSASLDGSPVDVVTHIGDDLNIVWQLKLPFTVSDTNFLMNSQAIYTISKDNMLTKIGLDGQIAFQMKMSDEPLSLTKDQADGAVYAWDNKSLYFYDVNGGYNLSVPFDAGNVIKAETRDDYCLIVSAKDSKEYYSGYDTDGKLLWRAVCSK